MTQTVLAREQKLSALGALAATAAHELGTPLATIAIVAREIARNAKSAAEREDADLLIAQALRCREILARLTATPAAADDPIHQRLSLEQLLQEVIEPYAGQPLNLEAVVTGSYGPVPDVRRLPEIIHALASFVENATDFARSEVLVTARFDARHISVEVRDDGPGFSPEILTKLGEPYVTSRPAAEESRSGHVGMGLGLLRHNDATGPAVESAALSAEVEMGDLNSAIAALPDKTLLLIDDDAPLLNRLGRALEHRGWRSSWRKA